MSDERTDADEGVVDAPFEEALEALSALEDVLGDVESPDELDDSTLEGVLDDLETLGNVLSVLEDVVETVDVDELPEAVDVDDLLSAVDADEIPDAIDDEDTGVGDVVDVTQVVRAIDLLSAWDATDLTALWEGKRDLEDALGGDESDDGLLEGALESVTDGEAVSGDDGLLEGDESLLDAVDTGVSEAKSALEMPDPTEDPDAYQVFIQQQAMTGIDAVRDALLEAHAEFERLVEYNRERTRRTDTSTNSRNPTAVSTMPGERAAAAGGTKYSTVPKDVHLSTAPSRTRIYGDRFRREREKRRSDHE